MTSHHLFALLLTLPAMASQAEPMGRPIPLSRTDMGPVPVTRIQQIQGTARAVLAARSEQRPDPQSLALRDALLQVRAEIGSVLVAATMPSKLANTPCAPGQCQLTAQSMAGSAKFERLRTRRETVASTIREANRQPHLAPLAKKAGELMDELDAADQAPPEERMAKLVALYKKLDPRPSAYPAQQAKHTDLGYRHTLAHHRPGVRQDHD